MNDQDRNLEEELRRVMRQHATLLERTPPLPELPPSTYRRPRSRLLIVVPLAAAVALVAGVALSQVGNNGGGGANPPTVTPVSERLVVAAGDTRGGPWQLTAYRAQLEGQSTDPNAEEQVSKAWCLDLDGPDVEEPGAPPTQRSNVCTAIDETRQPDPIEGISRIPEFRNEKALVYGAVRADVVQVRIEAETGEVEVVVPQLAPSGWELPIAFFSTFISTPDPVKFEALAEDGSVLQEKQI